MAGLLMAAGLPNMHVIGPTWESHHAPVTDDAMTATCTVTRRTAGQAVFDPNTGRNAYPDPVTVYSGRCRITQPSVSAGQNVTEVGDKPTTIAGYDLAVPLTAPILQVGDTVTITAATDVAFAGVTLAITAGHGGSLAWQRTYRCDQWTPTTR
jgi:hypothetical protein